MYSEGLHQVKKYLLYEFNIFISGKRLRNEKWSGEEVANCNPSKYCLYSPLSI